MILALRNEEVAMLIVLTLISLLVVQVALMLADHIAEGQAAERGRRIWLSLDHNKDD
jgi:hypothetical protein